MKVLKIAHDTPEHMMIMLLPARHLLPRAARTSIMRRIFRLWSF
jgi:hypothetical protein